MKNKLARIFLWVLFICITFSWHNLFTAAALGVNLIANASVETLDPSNPAKPQNWLSNNWGTNSTVFSYPNNGQDGAKSLSVQVLSYSNGDAKWYFQPVSVKASTKYTFSDYYKATTATQVMAQLTSTTGAVSYLWIGTAPIATNWTLFSVTFTTPVNTKQLSVFHLINKVGTLTTDSFLLAETNGVTPTPTLTPTVTPTATPTVTPTPTPTITPTLTPSPTPTPVPVSLIKNPSFETAAGSVPANWTQDKSGSNTSVYTYLNSGHTGNRSYQVQISKYTDGYAGYINNQVAVTASSRYSYSVYYKADTYVEFDAEIQKSDGTAEYVYLGSAAPSSVWNQYIMEVDTPAKATGLVITALISDIGYFVTDDHLLVKMPAPTPFNRPIVSFTFDDFFPTFFTYGLPKFKNNGMTATMYLVAQDLGQPGFATKAQLQSLVNGGFEIGSHTVTHPHLPDLTATQLDLELSKSQTDLSAYLGGIPIRNFASPFGEYNSFVQQHIAGFYDSHRSVDIGYNSKDNFDAMNIRAMSVNSNVPAATVMGWIDRAVADKTWLVLVYHDVKPANGDLYSTTPQDLNTVLSYLKQKNVSVQNVDAALSEVQGQLP